MKIGILSLNLHLTRWNYGSALQSFALYKYISNLHFETEIIDYLPKFRSSTDMRHPYKDIKVRNFKSLYRKIIFFLIKKVESILTINLKNSLKIILQSVRISIPT